MGAGRAPLRFNQVTEKNAPIHDPVAANNTYTALFV
jgi:hypothetical protein